MAGALMALNEQISLKFGHDPSIASDLLYEVLPVAQDGTGRVGYLLCAHPEGGIRDTVNLTDCAYAFWGDAPVPPANDNFQSQGETK
jgi:hypothetical protein